MCAMSNRRASMVSLARVASDALMRECEEMETELGRWLAEQSAWIAARARERRPATKGRRLNPRFLWRGLILLWVSSPSAKATYSSEAREGLAMAVSSMDDPTLRTLVEGLVDEAQRLPVDPAA